MILEKSNMLTITMPTFKHIMYSWCFYQYHFPPKKSWSFRKQIQCNFYLFTRGWYLGENLTSLWGQYDCNKCQFMVFLFCFWSSWMKRFPFWWWRMKIRNIKISAVEAFVRLFCCLIDSAVENFHINGFSLGWFERIFRNRDVCSCRCKFLQYFRKFLFMEHGFRSWVGLICDDIVCDEKLRVC